MSNPGVISLVRISDLGKRFEIEDNIGEAIHIHYGDIRLDMTIREFEAFSEQVERILDAMYSRVGFKCAEYNETFLFGLAKLLPEITDVVTDTVTLSDMQVDTFDKEGKRCLSGLKESRVFKALHGNTEENDSREQINLFSSGSPVPMTNKERLNENLAYIKENGYPNDSGLITLNGDDNMILDGQHRAACLLFLNGDQKVPVRRLIFRKHFSNGWVDTDIPKYKGMLYYATPTTGMSEETRRDILWSPGKRYHMDLPKDVTALRFDPIESGACLLKSVRIASDIGELAYTANNLTIDDGQVLFGEDPNITIVLDGKTPAWIEFEIDMELLGTSTFEKVLSFATRQQSQMMEVTHEASVLSSNLEEVEGKLKNTDAALKQTQGWLQERSEALTQTENALKQTQGWLQEKDAAAAEEEERFRTAIAESEQRYKQTDAALKQTQGWLQERSEALTQTENALKQTQGWLQEKDAVAAEAEERYQAAIAESEQRYKETDAALKQTQGWLQERSEALTQTENALKQTQGWLQEKDAAAAEAEKRFRAVIAESEQRYRETDAALKQTQEWLQEKDAAAAEAEERFQAAIAESEQRYRETDAALHKTQDWLQERSEALTQAENALQERDEALEQTRQNLREKESEAQNLMDVLSATEIQLAEKAAEYENVVNSASWKVTRPLRSLEKMIKKRDKKYNH